MGEACADRRESAATVSLLVRPGPFETTASRSEPLETAAPVLPEEILRFRRSERYLHWAIAVPFMVCYVTAAILVLVYNPNPTLPFRAVFSWLHRISGTSLAVLPVLVVLAHWRDFRVHLHNVRWGWTWTLDDVKWLLLMGLATFNSRIELPHQGKFNAGEKINFMAIMTTYPIYLTTGLLIWFAGIPFVTWLVHVYTAMFVATPLMVGHIFMAVVNPDTRVGLSGMITGFVDRHWARHHYRRWYDLTYGHAEKHACLVEARPGVETERRQAVQACRTEARPAAERERGRAAQAAAAGLPGFAEARPAAERERRRVAAAAAAAVVREEHPQPAHASPQPALQGSRAWRRLPGQILAIEQGANE